MTIQNLLDLVDTMYPNSATDAVVVGYMNMGQRQLTPYFNTLVVDHIHTTADVDEYSLPTGCTDVSQIKVLGVSSSSSPDDRYDYTPYSKSSAYDYPKTSNGYYQVVNATGTKKLVIYPMPTESGLLISVQYEKMLSDLSTSVFTGSPSFDSRYHDMLAMWACYMICSSGSNPDEDQSNHFMEMWKSGLKELYRLSMTEDIAHPKRRKDNRQWHNGKSYAAGGADV